MAIYRGGLAHGGAPAPGAHPSFFRQMSDGLHVLPAELELSTAELPWLVGNAATACQKSRFTVWLRIMERAKGLHALLFNTFPGEVAGHDASGSEHLHASTALQVGPLPTDGGSGCGTKGDLLRDSPSTSPLRARCARIDSL